MRNSKPSDGRGVSCVFQAVFPGGGQGFDWLREGVWRSSGALKKRFRVCLLFLDLGFFRSLGIRQIVKRADDLARFVAGDVLGSDVEALEERLVEEPPGLVRRRLIGRLNVGGQLEGVLETCKRFRERKLVLLDQPFRLGALPLDALALLEKQVVADVVLIVGVKELPLLRFEYRQAVFRGFELRLGFGPDLLDVAMHRRPHALALGLRQLDATITALNRGFDGRDPVVGLRAGVLLTALADEVVVVAAGAASHPREVEPPFALVAIEAAAQVVVVAPCPLAALPVSIEQVLNLLERLLVYERLMFAFDDLAVIANVAAVVVVAQHLGDPVDAERRFLGSLRRATAQATGGEDRRQL